MPFKYEKEIVTRKACDLKRFSERNRSAFCWCFTPIENPRNFIPRAKSTERDDCGDWGLSFFETQQQAEDRWMRVTKGKPNIYKHLGDHVANGLLSAVDGISEDCDENGHFNLHEYVDTNLSKTFAIIKKVA